MVNVVKVIDAGKGYTTVLADDGNTYRLSGARNWRNNNPGNIEYGPFARSMGAVGSDGRFAVFPTLDSGTAAQQHLQFESPSYKNLTVLQAINKYAPPSENNSTAYAKAVANAAGVTLDTPMSSLSPEQRSAFMAAQQQVEGFKAGQQTLIAKGAPRSDFSTMAQANINAAAMPPLPIPRPQTPTGGQVRGANTGTMYKVGDLIKSQDGVHTLRVVDKGNGVAGFEQVRSPFDIPGVINVNRELALQPDANGMYPNFASGYIHRAMDAEKAKLAPAIGQATQTVQQAAGTTQAAVGGALKQGQDALGNLGSGAVSMLGNLFNAQKAPTPPANVPTPPVNTGWSTVWQASPTPAPTPQRPPVAPPYVPTMPTGGPGTFAPSGLPAAPYMPTMPIGGPGTFGAGSMPAAPILPMSMPPQIGTPPGTQLRMTVNRAPQYIPPPMATIATGKRVPVGTVTPHGGVVQANGSINHGNWSTPGPGQPLKWWQANSMGYTV